MNKRKGGGNEREREREREMKKKEGRKAEQKKIDDRTIFIEHLQNKSSRAKRV